MAPRNSTMETTGRLADLVAGMGSLTPAPLFFVDESGHEHALNAQALGLPEDHGAAQAVLSPVAGRGGHVVAYVDGLDEGRSGQVVAAMVALTAQVVGRGLRVDTAAEPPLPPARALLDVATEEVARRSDVHDVAELVADAAQRALGASIAVVFTLREDGGLEAAARRGVGEAMLRRVLPGHGLLGWAATRGEATPVSSLFRLPADAPRDEGRHGALATWLQPPFALIPLSGGSQPVGLLCLAGLRADARGDVARRACELVAPLAERAGSAIAGAVVLRQARREERVRREIEIARQIQKRLLSGRSVEFPGLDMAAECRAAAQVGGDFHGFRAVGEDSLVATIFDVAGHGIGAAFCMTLVRSALHGEVVRGGAPDEVLRAANELASEDLAESGLFATAFLARFQRATGTLEYASAGHSRPVHWRVSERRFASRPEGGLPLGLFGDSRYQLGSAPFGEGDLLVLYTDGIVEAENAAGEPFGRSRLMGAVRRLRCKPARLVMKALWREVERFTEGRPLRDDATLVVVRGEAGFGTQEPRSEATPASSSVAARIPQQGRRRRARRHLERTRT